MQIRAARLISFPHKHLLEGWGLAGTPWNSLVLELMVWLIFQETWCMWATGPVLHLSMLVATTLMISLGAGPSLLSELDTLSISKVCRRMARKIVNQEVNLYQWVQKSSFGFCPCLHVQVVIFLCVCRHIAPERPIMYNTIMVCSFCLQPVWSYLFRAPALPVKPKDSAGAAALRDGYQQLQKEQIPTVDMSWGFLCDLPGWSLIFIADCKPSRHQKPSRGQFT